MRDWHIGELRRRGSLCASDCLPRSWSSAGLQGCSKGVCGPTALREGDKCNQRCAGSWDLPGPVRRAGEEWDGRAREIIWGNFRGRRCLGWLRAERRRCAQTDPGEALPPRGKGSAGAWACWAGLGRASSPGQSGGSRSDVLVNPSCCPRDDPQEPLEGEGARSGPRPGQPQRTCGKRSLPHPHTA